MSANPQDDFVNVVVDGVAIKARKGAMIIHVTDANDAYVPRFCYHDKLPIAANCRMCLVEVEKAPKPLPACATPVAEGMRIFTKSPNAIAAQKATMEFLLINHPLDCPICDQGGECELQDLAMGFGRDLSRFAERKRVVKDKNLGPLVSTDMTRCIHCTRCVRFGQDIAGIQELGTTGRGEHMEIGTYIERSVDHELSGNIIDLCPVGALNSKPFRYQGRSWEMTQHPLISPHDGFGTNVYAHVLRGRLRRVVPRPNEDINETWIADRDRFSYDAVYAADRAQTPFVRQAGALVPVSWEQALKIAVDGLHQRKEHLGVLAHPSSTLEELFLTARFARGLGTHNIDHRLRTRDFRDSSADPVAPWLGTSIAAVEALDALLVIGSNLRAEAPMLAHRVRKAARRGARVTFMNPSAYEYLFPVAAQHLASADDQLHEVLAVLAAASAPEALPAEFSAWSSAVRVGAGHRTLASLLKSGSNRAIWLGALALRSSRYVDLRAAAAALARATGATLGIIAEGGNGVGAWLAGCVPHRGSGGSEIGPRGMNTEAMLAHAQRAYLLVGGIEPSHDIAFEHADRSLAEAEFVVSISPFASDEIRRLSHVILPMCTFAETSGTYVNLEGRWQSQSGAASAFGEARPGWKILRVMGNLAELAGFGYQNSEEVRDEVRAASPDSLGAAYVGHHRPEVVAASTGAVADVPMYSIDALLRRSPSLQATRTAIAAAAEARPRAS